MNINQMKTAINKFRSADVSIIKDDATRAKAQKLQAKQKGFTLLELLVVITLLATLATAALVAYDGIGDSASDTAAANNLLSAQSALNNYRAIEGEYPDQWDNLANVDGDTLTDASGAGAADTNGERLAAPTLAFFGQWTTPSADTTGVLLKVGQALANIGIEEFQQIDVSGAISSSEVPNLAFNESGNANASELAILDEDNSDVLGTTWDETTTLSNVSLSIVPSGAAGTCTAGTVDLRDTYFDRSVDAATTSAALNLINDSIGDEDCALVIALGYGKDVPGTTLGKKIQISQVPTLGTDDVNPATNYARAIALFHVGSAADGATDVTKTDIFNKARLIGIVDPEGRIIDQVLAAANEAN